MSADDTTSIANCSFCRGEGLPILPVRYAIARTDSKIPAPRAPVVNGPFGEGVTDVATLPDGQDYTLRLMRAGFLYVYNEAAGTWSGYVVTEKGYLYAYVKEIEHSLLVAMDPANPNSALDKKLEPPAMCVEFSCSKNPQHEYAGRFITIPNPADADNIYLVFSDTKWTKRVWHEYATNEPIDGTGLCRRNYMRKISLAERRKGWTKHSAPISDLSDHVVESLISDNFSLNMTDEYIGDTGLGFGLDAVNGISGHAHEIKRWSECQAAEEGETNPFLIALNDPIGITSDIAMLVKNRTDEFNSDPIRKWPLATSIQISAIKESVKEKAEEAYRERQIQSYLATRSDPRIKYYLESEFEKNNNDNEVTYDQYIEQKALDQVDKNKMRKYANEEWNKYRSCMRMDDSGVTKRKKWEASYENDLNHFDNQVLLPLVKCYYNWLTSIIYLKAMSSNHDDISLDSGVSFSNIVSSCILDTQNHTFINDLYKKWLSAELICQDNILLRGLVLDNVAIKSLIDDGKKAKKFEEIDGKTILHLPWSGLIEGYSDVLEKHSPTIVNNANVAIARLLGNTMGASVSIFTKDDVNKYTRPLFFIMGMISQKAIVNVQVMAGVKADFYAELRKSIIITNEKFGDLDEKKFYRRIDIATRGEGSTSEPIGKGKWNRTAGYDYYLLSDFDKNGLLKNSLSSEEYHKAMFKVISEGIVSRSELKINDKYRFKSSALSGLRSNASVGLNVVSSILAIATLCSQIKIITDSGSSRNMSSLLTKCGAILAGFASSVLSIIESNMEKRAILTNNIELNNGSRMFKVVRGAGRLAGGVAAIVFAGLDLISAGEAIKKGRTGLAAAYVLSAGFGASAFVLLVASIPGWGWAFAVAAIFINLAITFFFNNDVQDWIDRSYFGTSDDKYKTFEQQAKGLKLISEA